MGHDEPHTAIVWLKRTVQIGREFGSDEEDIAAIALITLADIYYVLDELQDASKSLSDAEARLAHYASSPNTPVFQRYMTAQIVALRAKIAIKQGHYAEAMQRAAEAVRRFEADGKC